MEGDRARIVGHSQLERVHDTQRKAVELLAIEHLIIDRPPMHHRIGGEELLDAVICGDGLVGRVGH